MNLNDQKEAETDNIYPFLAALKWQGDRARHLSEQEEIDLYERNWRFVDVLGTPTEAELRHIVRIATKYNSWLVRECEKRVEALNVSPH